MIFQVYSKGVSLGKHSTPTDCPATDGQQKNDSTTSWEVLCLVLFSQSLLFFLLPLLFLLCLLLLLLGPLLMQHTFHFDVFLCDSSMCKSVCFCAYIISWAFTLTLFLMFVFTQSYCLFLFHFLLFYLLQACSFSKQRKKCCRSRWERAYVKTGKSRGRRNCNIICNKPIFNKNELRINIQFTIFSTY